MLELTNELRQILDELDRVDAGTVPSLVERGNDLLNEIDMEFNHLTDEIESMYRDMDDLERGMRDLIIENNYLADQLENFGEY